MLPCRDPIGLSGFRHALHLGLPFDAAAGDPNFDPLQVLRASGSFGSSGTNAAPARRGHGRGAGGAASWRRPSPG